MNHGISRRKFLGSVSIAAGAAAIPAACNSTDSATNTTTTKKQGMANIATISTMYLESKNTKEMVKKVLSVMEEIIPYKPDIICLPEIFAYANIEEHDYKLKDVAEKLPGSIVPSFQQFAARNKCYVICPTYILHNDAPYITAVVIDREGKIMGEYRKMRPAINELEMGIKPGKFDPPVFQTDFGTIGVQICFDIKYEEGWNTLKEKGAQIIFWPSAYAAGQEIASRAWRHQVYVVSSTLKDTSKICDITGEAIAQTNRWQRNWAIAPVNLEKAFILTWPAVASFPDIQKKYGSRIKITTFSEEEWSILESLDDTLKIADVLKEFNLKTAYQMTKELGAAHDKARETV